MMVCQATRYFFMNLICRKSQCFCMNASGLLSDLYYRHRCLSVMDCMWSSPIWSINYLSSRKLSFIGNGITLTLSCEKLLNH